MSIDFLSPENLKELRMTSVPNGGSITHRGGSTAPRKAMTGNTKFIKGQFLNARIPMAWLERVAALPGKGPYGVTLAIFFQLGLQKGAGAVKLTNKLAARFGVSRKAKYTALTSLEEAGLIHVDQQSKKTPVVTVIEVQTDPD